ncbi:MAG: hypothetical protein IPM69_05960 [Ignavibacteria bacterium]|nr:hypothetical protein [Ignavibacteria bacterium]
MNSKCVYLLVIACVVVGTSSTTAQPKKPSSNPLDNLKPKVRKMILDNISKTPAQIKAEKSGKSVDLITDERSGWLVRNKSKAIAFIPFTLKEISPDKEVTVSDTIIIEKNDEDGRYLKDTVEAGEYLDELNALEKKMNLWGKTQRNENDAVESGLEIDRQQLQKQKQSMPAKGIYRRTEDIFKEFEKSNFVNGKAVKPFTQTSLQEFENSKKSTSPKSGFQEIVPSDSAVNSARQLLLQRSKSRMNDIRSPQSIGAQSMAPIKTDIPPLLLTSFYNTAQKKWELGDRNKFSLLLKANSVFTGSVYKTIDTLSKLTHDQALAVYKKSATFFDVDAKATAEAYVLGEYFPLLDMSLFVHAPVHQDSLASMQPRVDVFGSTVWNPGKKTYRDFLDSATKKKEWKKSKTISFNLVVPVDVEVGIQGTLGVKYFAHSDKNSLDAFATPFADISGFAKCAVNLFIVRAGVEGKLTFLKGDINLAAHADIMYGNNEFIFTKDFRCNYNLNMLSGNIKAFADRRNWRFKWKRFWTHELFAWEGLNIAGDFENVSPTRQAFVW